MLTSGVRWVGWLVVLKSILQWELCNFGYKDFEHLRATVFILCLPGMEEWKKRCLILSFI